MIPFLKTVNLLQTLLFLGALVWFIFKIPEMSSDAVLIVIALLIIWLTIIALVGKFLFDAQKKKLNEESAAQLSVFEFIRRLQEEPKG